MIEKALSWFEKQSPIVKIIIYFWIALICLAIVMQIPNPKKATSTFNTTFETKPLQLPSAYDVICRDIYLFKLENKTRGNITCFKWSNGCICVEPM